MGAWGVLAFDNDDASDWAIGLEKVSDFSIVESAFQTLESANDYVEATDACTALAACEVVARSWAGGGYENDYTQSVDNWVTKHKLKPSLALIQRAQRAIQRILGDDSELRESWEESENAQEWRDTMEDLHKRLGA